MEILHQCETRRDIKQLIISGGITTYGDNVHSYNVEGGIVRELNIKGDIKEN